MDIDLVEEQIMSAARDSAENAILLTVAYADIFDAPLTSAQIHRYLIGRSMSSDDVNAILNNGIAPKHLYRSQSTFTLPERQHLITVSNERQSKANALWPLAQRYGQLIGRLPFVRMVAVTGSLAVDNPKEDADIDYLVVTANDRLWLARLFILGVVKLAARRGVIVCPNYLISERATTLREAGLYEARELAQMRVLSGWKMYRRLLAKNGWLRDYLPNASDAHLQSERQISAPKRMAEVLLSGRLGDWLEAWEQGRKIGKLGRNVISDTASSSVPSETNYSADVCKGHSQGHRQRTLTQLHQRLQSILVTPA